MKYIALVPIGVPLLILMGFFLMRSSGGSLSGSSVPPGAVPAATAHGPYLDAVKTWEGCAYVPIKIDESLNGRIKSLLSRGGGGGPHAAELEVSIQYFIEAFHRPDSEAYRRFRMPTDRYTFDPNQMKWHSEWLQAYRPAVRASLGRNPSNLSLFGARVVESARPDPVTGVYWSAICWNQSFFQIDSVAVAPTSFSQDIKEVQNAGIIGFVPTVSFDEAPEAVIARTGQLIVATVGIVAQTVHDDPPYPVVCRFYWAPAEGKWLPMQFGILYFGPRTSQPIF